MKGVDVASLEEISIAEGDWQRVFRHVVISLLCFASVRFEDLSVRCAPYVAGGGRSCFGPAVAKVEYG